MTSYGRIEAPKNGPCPMCARMFHRDELERHAAVCVGDDDDASNPAPRCVCVCVGVGVCVSLSVCVCIL